VVFALSVLFLALGILGNLPGAFLFLTKTPDTNAGSQLEQ
jgi:hypothetical protein